MKNTKKVFKRGQEIINLRTGEKTLLFRNLDKEWKRIRIVKPSSFENAKERLSVLQEKNLQGDMHLMDLLKSATDMESVESADFMALDDYQTAKSNNGELFEEISDIDTKIDTLKAEIFELHKQRMAVSEEIYNAINYVNETEEETVTENEFVEEFVDDQVAG